MGFPSLDEIIGQFHTALAELQEAAEKAATWPEALQEALSAEAQRMASEIDSLAREINTRPGGGTYHPEWYSLSIRPYSIATALPFKTGEAVLVEPDWRDWKEDRDTYERLFQPAVAGDKLEVVAYLDTEDERIIDGALDALEHLADVLGFGELEVVDEQRGSIFRRAWAGLKRGLASDDVQTGLAHAERAVYLAGIASKQAQVDQATASAVESLLSSIQDIPRACMRVGSVLLVKHQQDGQPVVMVRTLSSMEMAALEKFPGIQKDPEHVLTLLAQTVVEQAELERGTGKESGRHASGE